VAGGYAREKKNDTIYRIRLNNKVRVTGPDAESTSLSFIS
jgi:hypothetical protein